MSMSSLSAQLASLNSSGGKHPGSSLSTSRRHGDAIGRGISHSAQHGHALLSSSSSKYKPSVLYTDAREASDVPLTTLRENCVTSLQKLSQRTRDARFQSYTNTLAGPHSLKAERGLKSRAENDKLNAEIEQLLTLLGTALGESSSSDCVSCCLHVLEYLLRRYDIHLDKNSTCAERLVLTTLPHHEQPLFARILQLVNLASMPTFAFLRPHAAPGAPVLPRGVVSKRASVDTALLRQLCQLAQQTASEIHFVAAASAAVMQDGTPNKLPRRGISRVISFVAAVVTEALELQSRQYGSINEPTLRCLLPYVLSSCGGGGGSEHDKKKKTKTTSKSSSLACLCPDWRGFGHVVASSVAQHCVLASNVRERLATRLVQGAVETLQAVKADEQEQQQQQQHDDDDDDDNDDYDNSGGEDDVVVRKAPPVEVANALACLMAVLSQGNSSEARIELMTPHGRRRKTVEFLGLELSHGTFQALCKLECLTQSLGQLHEDCELDVSPLVASLVTVGLDNLAQNNNKTKAESLRVIIEMIREPTLESLWRNTELNLVASAASALVTTCANAPDENSGCILEHGRTILESLRHVDAADCDAGVAHAVKTLSEKKKISATAKSRMRSMLGVAENVQDAASYASKGETTESTEDWRLLPPRVALEHADVHVRLEAIQRLTREASGDDDDDDDDGLELAFVRHLCVEDELSVAVASGAALLEFLKTRPVPTSQSWTDAVLSAVAKWTLTPRMFRETSSKTKNEADSARDSPVETERLKALELSLSLAGLTARALQDDEGGSRDLDADNDVHFHLLLECIIAHLDLRGGCSDGVVGAESIADAASKALYRCVDNMKSSHLPDSGKDTTDLLFSNPTLLDHLRIEILSSEPISTQFRERQLWVYLRMMSDIIENSGERNRMGFEATDVADAISLGLTILFHGPGSGKKKPGLKKADSKDLLHCLEKCAQKIDLIEIERLPDLLISFAGVKSKSDFKHVAQPAIRSFCNALTSSPNLDVHPMDVILEASLRDGVPEHVLTRLIATATSYLSDDSDLSTGYSSFTVHGVALLGHTEKSVRESAVKFLAAIQNSVHRTGEGGELTAQISSQLAEEGKTASVLMGGKSALPSFLTSCIRNSAHPKNTKKFLLEQCVLAATARRVKSSTEMWTVFSANVGGCRAATTVLSALEVAGESVCPLCDRWDLAGEDITKAILEFPETDDMEMAPAVRDLIDVVARMLKGVKLEDETRLIISTGPSGMGTRSRSYSMEKTHGCSFISPYPKEMIQTLVTCLERPKVERSCFSKEMCRSVICNVFGSQSWGYHVFSKMESELRCDLALKLFALRHSMSLDGVGQAFLGLPLVATDILFLFKKPGLDEESIASLAFLADYIRSNADRLRSEKGATDLVNDLFEKLRSVSSTKKGDMISDKAEFARHAILLALLSLAEIRTESCSKNTRSNKLTKEEAVGRADLVVRLLGEMNDDSETIINPLLSMKTRTLAVKLLTVLCSQNPDSVVKSLVTAVIWSSVDICERYDSSGSPPGAHKSAFESLLSLVPVFFEYAAAAKLSIFDMFGKFITACSAMKKQTSSAKLYEYMIDALSGVPLSPETKLSPIGCFVASLLSKKISLDSSQLDLGTDVDVNAEGSFHSVASAVKLVQRAAVPLQVGAMVQFVAFSHGLVLQLSGHHGRNTQRATSMVVELEKIEEMIIEGGGKSHEMSVPGSDRGKLLVIILSVVFRLLSVVLELLSSWKIGAFIRKGASGDSELSLRLWQDLIILHSTVLRSDLLSHKASASGIDIDGANFRHILKSIGVVMAEIVEEMQNLLPAHIFLASTISLVQDCTDSDVQSKAIRFIGEKASNTDPSSPEASLLLDQLPLLAALLASPSESHASLGSESNLLLKQSVLLSSETLARSLCLQVGGDTLKRNVQGFVSILGCAADLLTVHAESLVSCNQSMPLSHSHCQLVCSSSLCASTLIRLLKARSLPLLPKLVAPMLKTLSWVNRGIISAALDTDKEQARVLQLSILRSLEAIAESLPQFFAPHVEHLLTLSGLPSTALRSDFDDDGSAVRSATETLEKVVATKIPARQLIPAVCKATQNCQTENICAYLALLSLLQESINSGARMELPGLRAWILKAVTRAYEFQSDSEERPKLIDSANQTLLAIVLKLSEAQLGPMYASLREWRGDVESEGERSTPFALRDEAFWSLSSVLSRELRVIFLPYMGTVVSDAVDDLNFAVGYLCKPASSKALADGAKRRRLESSTDVAMAVDPISLRFIQPLLLCLEATFKSDAHEGGAWIRLDDGSRYTALLEPLTKLLQCRVPEDFPLMSSVSGSKSKSSFEILVQGDGGSGGNVVGCLTALASAAGNEQLWKPLNHGVLQACGNELRSEVRKAGVTCLLSLIKTLGEEYMVLLPECLPVLSELLEDGDEDIIALAQECINIGEELLGESLQDSLR